MEFNLLPFNFTTLLLLSTFIFFLIKAWLKPKPHPNLPPSPPKLPVIGHLHLLAGDLPHRALQKVTQKHGPVLHLQFGEVPTVVISSREATTEVLKAQDVMCSDRPDSIAATILWYDNTDIGFSPYNDYWRMMRKICIVELLSGKNVRSFGNLRRDESSRMMRSIESSSGQIIDLTEKIYKFTSTITCQAAFGKVMQGHDVLMDLINEAVGIAGGFELADLFPSSKLVKLFSWNNHKLWKMRAKLDAILEGIVEDHKSKKSSEFGGEDLVDVLLRMQKTGALKVPITPDNVKGVIFGMFVAGTETSSNTTVWAMAELIRHPRVMEKLQAEVREAFKGKAEVEDSDVRELKYLKLVIKETFRLHPPLPLLPRQTRGECKADGYTIPNKTKLLFNVWALGRDPKYWEEPEVFRPERFEDSPKDFVGNDYELLPFGAGRRICPGLSFGLSNVELPLAKMLYHFDWNVGTGKNSDLDMSEAVGLAVARKLPLLLVPTLCNPLN